MSKPPDIRIRGIRQTIPPGYVLGRKGSADGPVQLISMKDLQAGLVAGGVIPPLPINNIPKLEFLGFNGRGPFLPLDQYRMPPVPLNVQFPSVGALASQSRAWAETPPTYDYTIYLTNDLTTYLAGGGAIIASVLFPAGSNTGIVTYVTPTLVPQRSAPWLVMQPASDPTILGVLIQFVGDPA